VANSPITGQLMDAISLAKDIGYKALATVSVH
jgi:hypothetical protein